MGFFSKDKDITPEEYKPRAKTFFIEMRRIALLVVKGESRGFSGMGSPSPKDVEEFRQTLKKNSKMYYKEADLLQGVVFYSDDNSKEYLQRLDMLRKGFKRIVDKRDGGEALTYVALNQYMKFGKKFDIDKLNIESIDKIKNISKEEIAA